MARAMTEAATHVTGRDNQREADCDECREKLALMNAVHDVGDVGQ